MALVGGGVDFWGAGVGWGGLVLMPLSMVRVVKVVMGEVNYGRRRRRRDIGGLAVCIGLCHMREPVILIMNLMMVPLVGALVPRVLHGDITMKAHSSVSKAATVAGIRPRKTPGCTRYPCSPVVE